MTEQPRAGSDVAERLARELLRDLEVVTDNVVNDILVQNAGYDDGARVTIDDLRVSCRENLRRVLQRLGGTVPDGADPFDAARDTGRLRAKQRQPLDIVLRSFRLGGRVLWRSLVEKSRHDTALDREELLDVATEIWTVIDDASSEVSAAYRAEQVRQHRVDEQRRHAVVEDLLRGRGNADDAFVADAAVALNVPAQSRYTVAVAAQPTAGPGAIAEPEAALAVHGVRSVWHVRPDTAVGIIALGDGHDSGDIAALLRPSARGAVGIAPAVDRLGEVHNAHRLAALACATLPPDEATVAHIDQRLPEAILASAPELAQRLVSTNLGALLHLTPTERDVLLRTLAVWLDCNGSTARTAATLYCHRNTVLNRMNRLHDLLDSDPQDARSHAMLSLALTALSVADLPAHG